MTDSDSEDLKTDNELSPPPVGRSRQSYDEADQINQLQMANTELEAMLLIQRKSSILNIHKMNALENELIAYKNKLEAEKYESEANHALVLQLEQHISNIQNEPTPHIQNQPSPQRTPPIEPPPPVPPKKPKKKEINTASTNILSNLEDLDKKTGYSKGRQRRRRASLPSINILPSFKSLKSVMGFGVDEDDKIDENKEMTPNIKDRTDKNNKNKSDKNIENHKNESAKTDKNKTLNKKLNPKEIKQLYIKNLKLQAQIDKYKHREKENQIKLQEQIEHNKDLQDQIALKSDVMRKLNDQVLRAENSNQLNTKIQELERLLVQKDTQIQSLKQDMFEIKTSNDDTKHLQKNENIHSRTLTPGGYEIHPTSWDQQQTNHISKHKAAPSAPPMEEYEDQEEDIQRPSLSLEDKLKQRPSWKEVQERGILLDDPTSKQSLSLQEAHRTLKRRRASVELDKLLVHRLNRAEMDRMMAATDSLMAASQIKKIKERLSLKLGQRPSIDETLARGILLHRTDTALNYDLQWRHAQMHRRKASENIEKLMFKRPTPTELEDAGILVSNPTQILRGAHRKKNSLDLEAGLKRRMSLSQIQGLGFLFSEHHDVFSVEEEDYDDEFMDDEEHNMNVAGLFKSEPRTSKPIQELQHEIPYDLMVHKEVIKQNKRRESVDQGEFEPNRLTLKAKMARIKSKLDQRPTVDDMRMRGLLYEHPSISKSLVERKRDLMRRRASNKIDHMLSNRPRRHELENRNILLREDETLDKRKRHKRKRSQNLEHAIQRRPKAMTESEAQRQRRRSMTDKDFKPDYLAQIDDSDYDEQIQEMEVRFLNVGGWVIPLVSPRFMSSLVAEQDNLNNNNNLQDIAELKDELEDLQEELEEKNAEIKSKDTTIDRMKDEVTQLRMETSRKSLLAPMSVIKKDNDRSEIEKLKKEIISREQYLSKLLFYLKENNIDISIPTQKELKKLMKSKLQKRFKARPSFSDLQRKAILSSNFINDVTNQNAQIAEKKLKFGRTSAKISEWLIQRPSKDSFSKYFVNDMPSLPSNIMKEESFEIIDNATVYELREEIERLNELLAEKVYIANKLERDNENMRIKIKGHLNETTEILSRGLQEHSFIESKILNQTLAELQKESEENQLISQLQEKNEKLQQKIRRLSTIDVVAPINETPINKLLIWSANLEWDEAIKDLFVYDNDPIQIMQNVINKQRENKVRITNLEEQLIQQEMHHIGDKEQFIINTMNEFNRLRAEIKRIGKIQQQQQHQLQQQQQEKQNNPSYYSYLTANFWK